MPIYAEIEGGQRLEFPDGTNPQIIQATVKRLLSQNQQFKADEPGMGEAALIAAGRGTDKIKQGVRQAFNWATGDQKTLDKMADAEADKDRLYKPLRDKYPITTGLGETAPALAAFPIGGGASLTKAAITAALPSLLSYGTPEERIKRGAADAAFGAAGAKAGQLVAGVLKPAGSGAANASDDALRAAERIGFKPTAGQITQNPSMLNMENYLLRNPGSSGKMQAVVSGQQAALNNAGARSMGETAGRLDEGVFAAAKDRIGLEFDRLGAVTQPQLGGNFLNSLAKIDADNMARGPFRNGKIDSLIDKGLDLAANNNLSGKAYKEIRTELANQAQTAFKAGDATTGQAYKEVVKALDDAAKSSLSKADQKAWDTARDQWAAFKTLTKSNVAEAGDVSAARTAAAVRARSPQFRTGGMSGDLADIARVGEGFKSVPNPNSGNQITQALASNPFTAIPFAAGNRMAAAAYMNPVMQRYLSRGLLDVGESGALALGQLGIHGGIPAGRGLLGVE